MVAEEGVFGCQSQEIILIHDILHLINIIALNLSETVKMPSNFRV